MRGIDKLIFMEISQFRCRTRFAGPFIAMNVVPGRNQNDLPAKNLSTPAAVFC
jgi:hypothetical protein